MYNKIRRFFRSKGINLEVKIGPQCGLEALHEHMTALRASWEPLGALLEVLGAEKSSLGPPPGSPLVRPAGRLLEGLSGFILECS